MKVYNTLTKRKEDFETLEPKKVSMYVCGPTVYNFIHVGNARPIVVFDAIRRYLEYKGYEVKHLQNFTDVDDRIIKRANEENVVSDVIANRYIDEMIKDSTGLNVLQPTRSPRATQEIETMIQMIESLITKGFAYERDGSVFFETGKSEDYGKLSNRNIEELEAGARIEIDENKKSPMDFVLWKPSKPNEPKWSSPWGEGRPGWHIECSAMIKRYLGDSIDIHAGGTDLIFPHHENEIAQSECANGKPMAKYWMHAAMINFDNQKMSKSKGNFFTLREIAEKYSYDLVRFFLLSVHYRSPLNFTFDIIQASENGYNRIKTCLTNLSYIVNETSNTEITIEEDKLLQESSRFRKDFELSMDDDFNTADAITAIFEFVRFANTNTNADSSKSFVEKLQSEIVSLCNLLGLQMPLQNDDEDKALMEKVNTLVEQRAEARKNKDFKLADKIRDELTSIGVIIEDTPSGVRITHKGR